MKKYFAFKCDKCGWVNRVSKEFVNNNLKKADTIVGECPNCCTEKHTYIGDV